MLFVHSRRSEMRGLAAVVALLALPACGDAPDSDVVVLGATHTLQDSGVLDSLAAAFRRAHPQYELHVIVSGTGEALEQARRGDIDVLLSHAPAAEQRAQAEGVVAGRRPLMYNHILIAGPAGDPADVRSQPTAPEALGAIAAAGAPLVTRDDSSGTHMRELELWTRAGLRPPRGAAYIRVGGGMADALRVADQRGAYVLTDPATFAVLRPSLQLVPLYENDSALRNTYAVMTVPAGANAEAAEVLHGWLLSDDARKIVDSFGDGLFHPAQEEATDAAPAVPRER